MQAREGLPVSGMPATSWESLRPKIVGIGEANKVRAARGGGGGGQSGKVGNAN